MATFTMELNEVLELLDDPGFTDWNSDAAGGTIGLGQYPLFTDAQTIIPDHRPTLNRKIIRRYWNREIGFETVSKFQLAMERRMDEIMPFYNQLYETELIKFDPLATFGLTTTRNDKSAAASKRNTTSHAENDTESVSRAQQSDTPQNELPDGWEEDADYASGGTSSQAKSDATADTNGTDIGSSTSTALGTSTTTGFQGSAADLLGKFRAQILNIDQAVVNAVNDLFMGIWDNGQELLPRNPGVMYGLPWNVPYRSPRF